MAAESREPARRIFSEQSVGVPQIELSNFSLPPKGVKSQKSADLTLREICALLGFYVAQNGISIPTIRDNLSVPSASVKQSKSSRGLLDYSTWDA